MALSLEELNSRINGDATAAPQRSLERVTSPVIYDKELKLGEYGANTPYSSLGNLNDFKAANQGWAWTLANGAVQGVANAALTTAQSIPTLGYTIASPFIAANDADRSWKEVMLDYLDSPAYQGFEQAKESIRNFSPVYRGSGFNLSEFVGSNVENLLTTVSLFVPAWAAARGATAAARAIGISSGVEYSLLKQLPNTVSRLGKASVAAVTSRHLESLMEAGQAGESTYQEYLSLHPGDTEGAEKAKKVAMGATYSWNMPALAMDLAQFYMGIPGFNFANRAVDKSIIKELIFQGASEAGEEAAQFIVSEEGKRLGLGDDSPMSEMDFLHRLGKYVQDPEFIESAALGAIGGQIFTGLQHYSNKFDKSYQAASKAWGIQQSKIKDYMDGKANDSATLLQHGDIDNDTFTNTLVQAAEFGHIGFPKQAIQDLLKQDEASLKTQFGADTQPTLFGKKATPHEVLNYRASQVEQFEKAYNDTKNTYGARTQEFQNSVLAHKLNANYYQDRTKALASQAMELESDLTTRWSSILTPEALSKAKAVSEVAAISKALAYANAQPKTDFWKKKTIELLNQKNSLEAAASTPEDISYFPIDELATAKANEKLSKITHDSIQDNLATLTNPKTTKQAEAVIQKEVKQEADAQKSTKLVELEEALDTRLAEITADAFTGNRISGIDAAVNDAIAQLDALKIGDTSIHKVIRQKGADAKTLAKQKARGTTTPAPSPTPQPTPTDTTEPTPDDDNVTKDPTDKDIKDTSKDLAPERIQKETSKSAAYNATGVQSDAEGNIIGNDPRDANGAVSRDAVLFAYSPEMFDYAELPVGTELTIVIDHSQLEKPLAETDPSHIPYAIQLAGKPNSPIHIHKLSAPIAAVKKYASAPNKIDANILKYIWEDKNSPNQRKEAELDLVRMREALYQQLVVNKLSAVKSTITGVSDGILKKNIELQPSTNVFTTTEGIVKDIEFGLLTNSGATSFNPEYEEKYASDNTTPKEWVGALIAFIPSFRKSLSTGWKIFHIKTLLSRNTISPADALSLAKVIKQYKELLNQFQANKVDNPVAKLGIYKNNKLISHPKDLINLFIHTGETGAIDLVFDNNTLFLGPWPNALNVDTATVQDIATRLEGYKYNFVKGVTAYPELTFNADGKLLKGTTVNYKEHIIKNTRTIVSVGQPLSDNRRQFTVQPKIYFDTQFVPTEATATVQDIEVALKEHLTNNQMVFDLDETLIQTNEAIDNSNITIKGTTPEGRTVTTKRQAFFFNTEITKQEISEVLSNTKLTPLGQALKELIAKNKNLANNITIVTASTAARNFWVAAQLGIKVAQINNEVRVPADRIKIAQDRNAVIVDDKAVGIEGYSKGILYTTPDNFIKQLSAIKVTPAPQTTQTPPPTKTLHAETLKSANELLITYGSWATLVKSTELTEAQRAVVNEVAKSAKEAGKPVGTWLREQLGTAFEPTYGESPNGYKLKEELLALEGDIFQQLFERYVAPLEGEIAQDGLRAYQILKNRGIKVVFDSISQPAKVVGDTLIINPNKLSQVTRAFPYILVHEALHLVGNNALVNPKTAAERQYKHRVTKAFLQTKQELRKKYPYAFKNLQEFMSEARSNPELREDLKRTKYASSNVFEKLWLWLKDLLGFSTNINQYLTTTLNEFLKSPNRPNEITAAYYEAPIDPFVVNQLINGMVQVGVQQFYNKKKGEDMRKMVLFQKVMEYYRDVVDRDLIETQESLDGLNEMIKNNGDNPFYHYLAERAWAGIKNQANFITQTDVEDKDIDDFSEEFDEGERGLGIRDEVFTTDPKESPSHRMRALLARIPSVIEVGEQLVEEYDSFGIRVMIPVDKVYDSLAINLADIPSEYIMKTLESFVTPTLRQVRAVLTMLQKDDNTTRVALDDIGLALAKTDRRNMYNEFISNFSKQFAKFITVRTDEGKVGVIDANSASAFDIISQNWRDKFLLSPLITRKSGTYTINQTAVRIAFDKFTAAQKAASQGPKFEQAAFDNIIESFAGFGIVLDGKRILKTYEGENALSPKMNPFYAKKTGRIRQNLKVVLNQFYKGMLETTDLSMKSLGNPYVNEGDSMERLAKLAIQTTDVSYTAAWRSAGNKNRYSINQNSLESHIIQELNSPEFNSKRLLQLEKSPFAQNSIWLKWFKNNPESIKQYYNADYGQQGEWKEYKNLTPTDKLIAQTVMFANAEWNGNERPDAYIEMLPHEAKTTVVTFKVPKIKYKDEAGKVGQLGSEMLDAFYTLIEAEAKTIILAKARWERYQKDNTTKVYRNYDYMELPDGTKDFTQGAKRKFQMFPYLNGDILSFLDTLVDVKDLAEKRAEINKLVQEDFTKEYEIFLNRFKELSLYKEDRLQFITGLRDNTDVLYNQLANYLISAGNYMQIFTNEMAFSKPNKFGESLNDFFKRTAMQLAPGLDNINPGELSLITLKDHLAPTAMLGNYAKHLPKLFSKLTDKETTKKLVSEILSNLSRINQTDAQGYVTLPEYIRLLRGWGRYDSEMESLLSKAEKKQLSAEEITQVVAQILKPVITTDIDDGEILAREYVKLSVIPLIPQFIEGNTMLEELAERMEKGDGRGNSIGWAVYDSAHKLGAAESIHLTDDIQQHNIQNIPYRGVRLQQETPFDANKKQVSSVSQARKLIFQDLVHPMFEGAKYVVDKEPWNKPVQELKEHYDNLYLANFYEAIEQFKTDYGIDLSGDKAVITDIIKVNELLKVETARRGYSANMQQALQLTDDQKQFAIPLWITPNSVEFEGLLFSIISKNIIKQKRTGKSYIQASSFGIGTQYRNIVHIEDIDSADVSEEVKKAVEKAKKEQALLGSYINLDNVLEGGQVLISSPYDKQLGRTLTFQEAKDAGLLELFAMRIPNQGHSSMLKVQVAGFLPKAMGDVVIVHPEILAQMGSDFDVDKLYIYFYNVEDYQGKARKVPYLTNSKEAYHAKYNKWKELNTEEAELVEEAKKLSSSLPVGDTNTIFRFMAGLDDDITEEVEEKEAAKTDTLARLSWVQKQKKKLEKGLQISSNIPTETDVEVNSIERQNTRLARDNRMLDIEKAIYSVPQMMMKIVSGNTIEPYTDSLQWFYDVASVDEVRKKIGGTLNPLSPNTHNTLWEINQAAKAGIAWASLWSTAYAMFQYTKGIKLNFTTQTEKQRGIFTEDIKNIGVKVITGYDNGVPIIPNDKEASEVVFGVTTHKYSQFGVGTFGVVQARDTKDKLTLLSKVFEIFMSIMVDDAKNQVAALGNLNEETLQVDLYMTGVGISDWQLRTGLRLQPIIQDYVKAVRVFKSSRAGYEKDPNLREIEIRGFAAVKADYENRLREVLPADAQGNKQLPTIIETDIRPLESSLLKQWGNTKYEELSNVDKVTWLTQQLEVLNAYKHIFMKAVGSKSAPGLSKLIVALNIDTKGLPMNYILTAKKSLGYIRALKNEDYSDLEDTLDQTTYGPILKMLAKALTVYTAGDNAVLPYGNKIFSSDGIVDTSLSQEKIKDRLSAVYTYMVSHINTKLYPVDLETYRANLMGLSPGTPSLFERVLEFRETSEGSKFDFLFHIVSNPKEDAFTPVEINRNSMEKTTYDYYISQLIKMLKNPKTEQLAKDIIAYSFFTRGISMHPKGYNHLVPINYLAGQYATFFREDGAKFFDEHLPRLRQQFYQHNKEEATYQPWTTNLMNNKAITAKTLEFETKLFSDPFVKMGNKDSRILFQFVQPRGDRYYYRRLNLLGHGGVKGIMEYNSNIDKWTSVFKDNNVPGNDTPAVMPVEEVTTETDTTATPNYTPPTQQQPTVTVVEQVGTPTREYTPDIVQELKPNEVFVFGSNTEGRHGKGAALVAKSKFGAVYGQAEGLQGQSYAIITKDLAKGMKSIPLEKIGKGIQDMLLFAKANPEKKFLVTKLGSSLAGYTPEEIKGLFEKLTRFIPSNVILPQEYEVRSSKQVDTMIGQITETGFVPTKGAEMLAKFKNLKQEDIDNLPPLEPCK